MATYRLLIQPQGVDLIVVEGKTVMSALQEAKIEIDLPCGGKGKCGKCRIKVLRDAAPATPTEEEFLDSQELHEGIRLACVTKVTKDMVIQVDFDKAQHHQILKDATNRLVRLEPHLHKYFVQVNIPSLEEPKSDWLRLKEALFEKGLNFENLEIALATLYQLPTVLREGKHQVTALVEGNMVVGVEAGDTSKTLLGMAFDIGTTSIVGYLMDLITGKELTVASTINPQTQYGADVISRINHVFQASEGLDNLHGSVIQAINRLMKEASEKAGVDLKDIYLLTVAGNTTMHHLFLGVTPKYLSTSPFVSVINEAIKVSPRDLNLEMNSSGKVLVLPNIAGFVGADTVAVLLSTDLAESTKVKLMVDIGTNGEIVLGSKKQLVSCSAAAGPAFEGAEITSGMRGAQGAIDHVYFKESFQYSVIGAVKPKGICGSALLDVVAGLLKVGIINDKGKILTPEQITNPEGERFKDRIIQWEEELAFLLEEASETDQGRPIVVTQNDIRQLQLAKGAMSAGIKILIDKLGITVQDIEEVLLAGAFGNYMDPNSACLIGLIPKELKDRITLVGNAAGQGSKIALLSKAEFQKAMITAPTVGHVDLASYPRFNIIFAKSTYFKD